MNHRLQSPSFLMILVIMILIAVSVPTSGGVDNEHFVNCGNRFFQCGNLENIGYPFWGDDRPAYCGHPELQLNCQNDVAHLTIDSTAYRVLAIEQTDQSLTVREDFWNSTCPIHLHNATFLDTALFIYASDTRVLTLHYGCISITGQPQPQLMPFEFTCEVNDTTTTNYYGFGDLNKNLVECNSSVNVQVSGVAADTLLAGNVTNLGTVLDDGFMLQWAANNTACVECVESGGRCGFNSRSFTCYCIDRPYAYRCRRTDQAPSGSRWNVVRIIVVGISALAGLVIIAIISFCCFKRKCPSPKFVIFWRKEREKHKRIEALLKNCRSLTPKRYTYPEIKRITKSFKYKLGQGGYGGVYKGELQNGLLVAVKVLNESKGNGEEFINEVASISRTSHVNIVTLMGFCFEGNKRALIYEFMPNGSLEKFIYEKSLSGERQLDWKTLYQIAVGIAQGLEYLHRGCSTRILHFDIKPHNILLDKNFCPKISDFGLSKLCLKRESIISMQGTRGTAGYIAPEIFSRNFGGVSHKSDVYSYGMMVLEMVGERKNIHVGVDRTSEIYFPKWIYNRLELDEDLGLCGGMMNEEENERARKMIIIGLWCIQTDPTNRPSMSKVMEMLEGPLGSLDMPPRPFLSSPPRQPAESLDTQIV